MYINNYCYEHKLYLYKYGLQTQHMAKIDLLGLATLSSTIFIFFFTQK